MTKCSEHTRDSTESSDRPVTSPPLLIEPCHPETDNGPSAGAIPLYHLFNLTSPHLPSQQHDSEALLVSPTPQNVVPASDLPTVANAVDSANQNLIGKKVLLTTVQRISTQVYQRFLAQAVGEMLRGTVYEGFTPEHLPTLLQASQDFYESEADLPLRLARLLNAVNELPDESFFEAGHHLKDALQLCVAITQSLGTLASSDSVLEKAVSGHRHLRNLLETLLDNSLLKTWSTLSGGRDIIEKSLQLLTETAPLMTPDISFEQVMNWASQSPLLKHLLTEHYQGIAGIFYELGILANLLRLRQAAQPDASTLSHGAWLLETLDSKQLGPLITEHLSSYLAPFFTSLHNMAKAFASPNRFPADTSGLAPFKWLSDSNVLEVLPAPLKALVYRFIEALGNTDSLRCAVGDVPANGKISDLCRWLARALEQPKFELIAKAVMDVELFDTLSRWSNQAVLLHQQCAAFAGVEGGPAALKWSLTLLERVDLSLLEHMLPAVLHERLANWLMPLLHGLKLAPLLEQYPHNESQMAQLIWGAHLVVSEQATPFLNSFLPQSLAQQLVKPFDFIRQTTTFPSDDSYTAQLQWTINLLASPAGQATLQQFAPEGYDYVFTHLHSVNTMMRNTDELRAMLMDNAPWQSKAQQLYAVLSPPLIEALKSHPELLINAASWASGGNKTAIGLSLTTLRFYMTMPSQLSTRERLIWILKNSAYEAINEYSTVLAWLVTHDSTASTVLSHAQQAQRIYSTWSQPEKLEAELDELVKMLNRDMPLPHYLQPLLNTLPALPALIRAHQHYTTLPDGMPVEEQTLHMAAYLSQTDSAALARLYDSIEAYAVGGISHALHTIAEGVQDPLKFPTASAAPVDQPIKRVPRGKIDEWSTQTKMELVGGTAGLAISVLAGAWAWKHWGKSGTQAYSPANGMPMQNRSQRLLDSDAEEDASQPFNTVYKGTTARLPSKHDPAKAALALSVLGFVVSSGLLIKGVYNAVNPSAIDITTLITTLQALEEQTQDDLETGHQERLMVDIDHYVEELSGWLDQQIYKDQGETQASAVNLTDDVEEQGVFEDSLMSGDETGSVRVRRSIRRVSVSDLQSVIDGLKIGVTPKPVSSKTEDFQSRSDEILTLMRWGVRSLNIELEISQDNKSEINHKVLTRRLAQIKSKLVALRQNLATLNMDIPGRDFLSREIKAYSLLNEMRAFYAHSNELRLWNNFDPDTVYSYEYTLHQESNFGIAHLIALVSGAVTEHIKEAGATGSFNLDERYNDSEVTPLIKTGISLYIPGQWTKERALIKAGIEASQGGSEVIPKMTDAVRVGLTDSQGRFRFITLQSLDQYLIEKRDNVHQLPYNSSYTYQWLPQYSAALIETLMSEPFLTTYFSGDTLIAQGEDRQQHIRTILPYTIDDALFHTHLIIQNSFKALVSPTRGTPIGFTEESVLAHAIRYTKDQLDLNNNTINTPATSDTMINITNNSLANLHSVLRVLYRLPSEHLRLQKSQTSTDLIMLAFVETLWTDPELALPIKYHPQLKNLKPQSPLIVRQLKDNNPDTRFTMTFAQLLCRQNEDMAPPATVIWPGGLSQNDPLLHTLIDKCTVYRVLIPSLQRDAKARESLIIPSTMAYLQEGLDRVIREKAPAGAKHLRQRLNETLEVKFQPVPQGFYNPDASQRPKEKVLRFSIAKIMAKAHKRKLKQLPGYMSYTFTASSRFPIEVIRELETLDWQEEVHRKIRDVDSDIRFMRRWKDVFRPLVTEKMTKAGVEGGSTLNLDGTPIPGVYILTTAQGVELHSVFNKTEFKAPNLQHFNTILLPVEEFHGGHLHLSPEDVSPEGKRLYNWLNEHRPDSERTRNSIRNTLTLKEPRYPSSENSSMIASSILHDYLDGMKKDADAYLKSNAELFVHNLFHFFNNIIAPFLAVLTIPISGPLAYLIASGLVILPFAELAAADTEEEFNDLFYSAALNVAFDILPGHTLKLLSKIPAHQIAKSISNNAISAFNALKGPKQIKTASANIAMPIKKIGPQNAIRDAVRANILAKAPNTAYWDYVSDILQNGNILTKVHADEFANGLKMAANYKYQRNTGSVDHLFTNVRTLTSFDQLLHVKQGEVLVFMRVDPSSPLKQLHPVHSMPALGNGRFAGLNNMVLDPALGPGKRILTAEQLGSFTPNGFTKAGSVVGEQPLQIKVGYPKNSTLASVPTFEEAAKKLAKNSQVGSNSADYIADIFQQSGELAAEQIQAFKEFSNILLKHGDSAFSFNVTQVVHNLRAIDTVAQLKSLSKGQILLIAPTDFSARNMLVSLGNNKFAGSQLDQLSPWFPDGRGIVNADELGALMQGGKIGNQVLKVGTINLQGLRSRALLGRDSFITFNSGVLTIRAHGQISIVNYLDASELADIIRGIMSTHGGMKALSRVELESCWGAKGNTSTGKSLSVILDKTVVAYPQRFNTRIPLSVGTQRGKAPITFTPPIPLATQTGAQKLEAANRALNIARNDMKSHDRTAFWLSLKKLFLTPITSRVSRSINNPDNNAPTTTTVPTSNLAPLDPFEELLNNASDLVMHTSGFDTADFLESQPDYLTGSDSLDASARSALITELKVIVAYPLPDNADEFAERMMMVLTLTETASNKLEEHLENNRTAPSTTQIPRT
ncbi:hypothetical protein [Pseudomonas sp. TMW22091]|uniref:hypothetical protein n=1 Tax=Pseudomonas sp. TMW22091 TaxID=2506435 RepID=UPI001F10A4A0|nr:hypothetical protein [Pseudomonas sp. TMW22091]MCH4875238.1 hypothetical protein [Pseudomonas sp. TMW22091]